MEKDIPLDPMNVSFFGPVAVVARPDRLANLVKQLRLLSRRKQMNAGFERSTRHRSQQRAVNRPVHVACIHWTTSLVTRPVVAIASLGNESLTSFKD